MKEKKKFTQKEMQDIIKRTTIIADGMLLGLQEELEEAVDNLEPDTNHLYAVGLATTLADLWQVEQKHLEKGGMTVAILLIARYITKFKGEE